MPRGRPKKELLGITQMEFAKREKLSLARVNQAVKFDELPQLADGSLDPKLVGTGWCQTNRKKIAKGEKENPNSQVTENMSFSLAEQKKAVYEVLKRKREHDLAVGTVVLIDQVSKQVGEAYASARTKLLSLGAEHAPQIHALKTPAEVKDYMDRIITRSLEELVEHVD